MDRTDGDLMSMLCHPWLVAAFPTPLRRPSVTHWP